MQLYWTIRSFSVAAGSGADSGSSPQSIRTSTTTQTPTPTNTAKQYNEKLTKLPPTSSISETPATPATPATSTASSLSAPVSSCSISSCSSMSSFVPSVLLHLNDTLPKYVHRRLLEPEPSRSPASDHVISKLSMVQLTGALDTFDRKQLIEVMKLRKEIKIISKVTNK
jgi:hypothetical protein